MKKIKCITCHDVANYGASLQAYALQRFVTDLGYNYQIIDYKPKYQNSYDIWSIDGNRKLNVLARRFKPFHWYVAFKKYLKLKPTFPRLKSFALFKQNYLVCTKTYHSYKELLQDPPEADVYISGSDQIWNSLYENGKDPSFYLKFGDVSIKRLAYAASFGTPTIDEKYKVYVKSLLHGYDCITVREEDGVSILENLGHDGDVVLDPVFLLTSSVWSQAFDVDPVRKFGDYILVYDFYQEDSAFPDFVVAYAREHRLKVVSVNDRKMTKYADININDAGPIEFLHYIKNARFVVSNSFHATAFSVIFNIPFLVFYRNKQNTSRLYNFLERIGLQSRINPNNAISVSSDNIDWESVNEIVEEWRIKSQMCLKNMLK